MEENFTIYNSPEMWKNIVKNFIIEHEYKRSTENNSLCYKDSYLTVEKKFSLFWHSIASLNKYFVNIASTYEEFTGEENYYIYEGMDRKVAIRRNEEEFILDYSLSAKNLFAKHERNIFSRKIIEEEEFLEIARNLLVKNKHQVYNHPIIDASSKIITKRKRYTIQDKGNIVEVNFDRNEFDFEGYPKKEEGTMLIIKSKKGDPVLVYKLIEEIEKLEISMLDFRGLEIYNPNKKIDFTIFPECTQKY